jgi:hypothetical protein
MRSVLTKSSDLLCFLWSKGLNAKDIHKEIFPVYGGKCCGSQLGVKCFADDEEVETEVRKWLRQQSKRFLCHGFRRTGKAIGQVYKCWWRICREINVFSRFEYHMFYILYPFVIYLLTHPLSSRETLRFWGTSRLNLQGRTVNREIDEYEAGGKLRPLWTTRRHITEDFLCNLCCDVRLSPLCRPHMGLLYQPQVIDVCGAVGGMRIGRGNRSTRRKPIVPLCPSQIPHDLTWNRTWTPTTNRLRYDTSFLEHYRW